MTGTFSEFVYTRPDLADLACRCRQLADEIAAADSYETVRAALLTCKTAQAEMMTMRSNELLNAILDKYTLEAEFDKILLGYVNLGGEENSTVPEIPAEKEELVTQNHMPVIVIAMLSVAALVCVATVLNKKEHEE